jgi:hypothetical protein
MQEERNKEAFIRSNNIDKYEQVKNGVNQQDS